jgi:hypothetical protein
MVWLYRSPIVVGVGGYFTRSSDFYTRSRRLGGGGGRHPVRAVYTIYIPSGHYFTLRLGPKGGVGTPFGGLYFFYGV